jgi:hypothetical protein
MVLSDQEKREQRYVQSAPRPVWGGHLERGEPVTDPTMKRWIDLGLIEAVGTKGYILTSKGAEAVTDGES